MHFGWASRPAAGHRLSKAGLLGLGQEERLAILYIMLSIKNLSSFLHLPGFQETKLYKYIMA
jgi:hypothetical protein